MRKIHSVLVALILALALCGANAFNESDIELTENIYLTGDKTIDVSVYNPALEDKDLSVRFLGPEGLDYEFKNVPSEIRGEGKANFTLTLKPKGEIFKTKYAATLAVELGNETVLKETRLHFSKPGAEEEEEGTGLFSLGMFWLGLTEDSGLLINFILLLIAVVLFAIFVIKVRER